MDGKKGKNKSNKSQQKKKYKSLSLDKKSNILKYISHDKDIDEDKIQKVNKVINNAANILLKSPLSTQKIRSKDISQKEQSIINKLKILIDKLGKKLYDIGIKLDNSLNFSNTNLSYFCKLTVYSIAVLLLINLIPKTIIDIVLAIIKFLLNLLRIMAGTAFLKIFEGISKLIYIIVSTSSKFIYVSIKDILIYYLKNYTEAITSFIGIISICLVILLSSAYELDKKNDKNDKNDKNNNSYSISDDQKSIISEIEKVDEDDDDEDDED